MFHQIYAVPDRPTPAWAALSMSRDLPAEAMVALHGALDLRAQG